MKILSICLLIGILNIEKVQNIALTGDFNSAAGLYVFKAKNFTILSRKDRDRTITKIVGTHAIEKSNENVDYFYCESQNVKFFPLEISKFFPNLKYLIFVSSNLTQIEKSDLKQFGAKLESFNLRDNKITSLEKSLFKFNPNLININFANNKIVQVKKGAFKGLTQLNFLDFSENSCINNRVFDLDKVLNLISEAESKCKK